MQGHPDYHTSQMYNPASAHGSLLAHPHPSSATHHPHHPQHPPHPSHQHGHSNGQHHHQQQHQSHSQSSHPQQPHHPSHPTYSSGRGSSSSLSNGHAPSSYSLSSANPRMPTPSMGLGIAHGGGSQPHVHGHGHHVASSIVPFGRSVVPSLPNYVPPTSHAFSTFGQSHDPSVEPHHLGGSNFMSLTNGVPFSGMALNGWSNGLGGNPLMQVDSTASHRRNSHSQTMGLGGDSTGSTDGGLGPLVHGLSAQSGILDPAGLGYGVGGYVPRSDHHSGSSKYDQGKSSYSSQHQHQQPPLPSYSNHYVQPRPSPNQHHYPPSSTHQAYGPLPPLDVFAGLSSKAYEPRTSVSQGPGAATPLPPSIDTRLGRTEYSTGPHQQSTQRSTSNSPSSAGSGHRTPSMMSPNQDTASTRTAASVHGETQSKPSQHPLAEPPVQAGTNGAASDEADLSDRDGEYEVEGDGEADDHDVDEDVQMAPATVALPTPEVNEPRARSHSPNFNRRSTSPLSPPPSSPSSIDESNRARRPAKARQASRVAVSALIESTVDPPPEEDEAPFSSERSTAEEDDISACSLGRPQLDEEASLVSFLVRLKNPESYQPFVKQQFENAFIPPVGSTAGVTGKAGPSRSDSARQQNQAAQGHKRRLSLTQPKFRLSQPSSTSHRYSTRSSITTTAAPVPTNMRTKQGELDERLWTADDRELEHDMSKLGLLDPKKRALKRKLLEESLDGPAPRAKARLTRPQQQRSNTAPGSVSTQANLISSSKVKAAAEDGRPASPKKKVSIDGESQSAQTTSKKRKRASDAGPITPINASPATFASQPSFARSTTGKGKPSTAATDDGPTPKRKGSKKGSTTKNSSNQTGSAAMASPFADFQSPGQASFQQQVSSAGPSSNPGSRRQSQQVGLSVAAFNSANVAMGTAWPIRTFPATVPIDAEFPRFYRRFPVPSSLAPSDPVRHTIAASSAATLPLVRIPATATFHEPSKGYLDLYSMRYTKGTGSDKYGLCPICCEPEFRGGENALVWQKTKVSAFNYHMSYYHGISNLNGLPFSPPLQIRVVPRPTSAANERDDMKEGFCHSCNKWIPLQGVKLGEVKVKELYWFKHAKACHRDRVQGETDEYIEDSLLAVLAPGPNHSHARRASTSVQNSHHAVSASYRPSTSNVAVNGSNVTSSGSRSTSGSSHGTVNGSASILTNGNGSSATSMSPTTSDFHPPAPYGHPHGNSHAHNHSTSAQLGSSANLAHLPNPSALHNLLYAALPQEHFAPTSNAGAAVDPLSSLLAASVAASLGGTKAFDPNSGLGSMTLPNAGQHPSSHQQHAGYFSQTAPSPLSALTAAAAGGAGFDGQPNGQGPNQGHSYGQAHQGHSAHRQAVNAFPRPSRQISSTRTTAGEDDSGR